MNSCNLWRVDSKLDQSKNKLCSNYSVDIYFHRVTNWVIRMQYEKHKAKKDLENAHNHKIQEEITTTLTVGEGGYIFHEHHRKKESKKEVKELHMQPPTARADAFPFAVVCDVRSDLSFIGLLDVMCPTSVGIQRETFNSLEYVGCHVSTIGLWLGFV